jgi:hypothetical protein
MKKILLSLVVLVSMLFSFQAVSQALAFRTLNVSPQKLNKFGDYTFPVDTLNLNDTLFYFKFTDYNNDTYIYYGIIDDTTSNVNNNGSVKLKLHLESTGTFNQNDAIVALNNTNITGTEHNAHLPMMCHFIKDTTIATNQILSFDTLRVGDPTDNYPTTFAFSFKFTSPMYVGFEDNFFPEKETFKLYPNPCENTLNVNADGLKRIFGINGRLVKESYEKVIDMSDLTPGMYVVMLESGARIKVVKE